MEAINKFLRATIVGGLIFLVPVVLILIVLGRALEMATNLAKPIAAALPPGITAGMAAVTVVAVLILILIALFAGLVARTTAGRKVTGWFEESLLGGMPQYRMAKSVAEGLAQIESGAQLKPALFRGDEGWMLVYVVEDLRNDWLAIFVPQAPTPMSGNVLYVPASMVRPLNIPMSEAVKLVKRMGTGSAGILQGIDLRPPA